MIKQQTLVFDNNKIIDDYYKSYDELPQEYKTFWTIDISL